MMKTTHCRRIAQGAIAAALCFAMIIFVGMLFPREEAYASQDTSFDYIWIPYKFLDLSDVGDTGYCSATLYPEDTDVGLQYKSLNEDVAAVTTSGVIAAKGIGYTKIEISAPSGLKSTMVVRVGGTAADQNVTPELVANYNVVRLHDSYDHWMAITPIPYAGLSTLKPSLTSSNPACITSSDWDDVYSYEFIKAVSEGSATVTARLQDGRSCSFTAIVDFSTSKPIQAERVTLNTSSIALSAVNQTYRLAASVYPTNAADKSIAWASSNTAVATVANGLVTARGNGTATITARTANGLTGRPRHG